jgi:hypothetical protein
VRAATKYFIRSKGQFPIRDVSGVGEYSGCSSCIPNPPDTIIALRNQP